MPVYQTLNSMHFLQATSGFLQDRERKAEINGLLDRGLATQKGTSTPRKRHLLRGKVLPALFQTRPSSRQDGGNETCTPGGEALRQYMERQGEVAEIDCRLLGRENTERMKRLKSFLQVTGWVLKS